MRVEDKRDLTFKLYSLSSFIESKVTLDEDLRELVMMAANIMNVENCSIMLLKDSEDGEDITLRVFAHSGHLPEVASKEAMKIKQGIAGQVAASGKPLFIEDIDKSKYARLKRGRYKSREFMSVPIIIHERVAGVINANTPIGRPALKETDFELLKVVALFIGKSLQVIQLQNLLRSKYVQFALSKETEINHVHLCRNNNDVAKILAKTFYNEMIKAGFAPDHMITAATEILTLINTTGRDSESECKAYSGT